MKILGKHLIVEYVDCPSELLNDMKYLEDVLKEAVSKAGATIVKSVFHEYNPQGVSGVIVIAESHMSIHTWPEYGYAAVDFFTCGEDVDPYKAHLHLMEAIDCPTVRVTELKRGIPTISKDEVLQHKPVVGKE